MDLVKKTIGNFNLFQKAINELESLVSKKKKAQKVKITLEQIRLLSALALLGITTDKELIKKIHRLNTIDVFMYKHTRDL